MAACGNNASPSGQTTSGAAAAAKSGPGNVTAADDAECRRQPACAAEGLCSWVSQATYRDERKNEVTVNNVCVAKTDADCQSSAACRDEKRCTAHHHECTTRCGGEPCTRDGLCTEGEGGTCVATREEDCGRSSGCNVRGLCTLSEGKCVASSDELCAGSRSCALAGLCALDPAKRRCAATRPEHCAKSVRCHRTGACKLDGLGGCQ